jgi:hypothetical protein
MTRISEQEFERKMMELVRRTPPLPSPEEDERFRRAEFDLLVDHRLGVEFPADRREQLWAVHQRANNRRIGMVFRRLLSALVPGRDAADMRALVDRTAPLYATVLSQGELERFLGVPAGQRPALPVDEDPLPK